MGVVRAATLGGDAGSGASTLSFPVPLIPGRFRPVDGTTPGQENASPAHCLSVPPRLSDSAGMPASGEGPRVSRGDLHARRGATMKPRHPNHSAISRDFPGSRTSSPWPIKIRHPGVQDLDSPPRVDRTVLSRLAVLFYKYSPLDANI